MRDCDQEMCPHWDGSGCPCKVLDIERPEPGCDYCGRWHTREDCPDRDSEWEGDDLPTPDEALRMGWSV